jgi:hypothetical protein
MAYTSNPDHDGKKSLYYERGDEKHITLCAAHNLHGRIMMPLIVLARKFLSAEWVKNAEKEVMDSVKFGLNKGVRYHWACSESGGVDAYIIRDYLIAMVKAHVKVDYGPADHQKKVLVFVDWHFSRMNPGVNAELRALGIHMVSYLPNATWAMQSLDIVVYAVVKRKLNKMLQTLLRSQPDKGITELQRVNCALESIAAATTTNKCREALEIASIDPFDCDGFLARNAQEISQADSRAAGKTTKRTANALLHVVHQAKRRRTSVGRDSTPATSSTVSRVQDILAEAGVTTTVQAEDYQHAVQSNFDRLLSKMRDGMSVGIGDPHMVAVRLAEKPDERPLVCDTLRTNALAALSNITALKALDDKWAVNEADEAMVDYNMALDAVDNEKVRRLNENENVYGVAKSSLQLLIAKLDDPGTPDDAIALISREIGNIKGALDHHTEKAKEDLKVDRLVDDYMRENGRTITGSRLADAVTQVRIRKGQERVETDDPRTAAGTRAGSAGNAMTQTGSVHLTGSAMIDHQQKNADTVTESINTRQSKATQRAAKVVKQAQDDRVAFEKWLRSVGTGHGTHPIPGAAATRRFLNVVMSSLTKEDDGDIYDRVVQCLANNSDYKAMQSLIQTLYKENKLPGLLNDDDDDASAAE